MPAAELTLTEPANICRIHNRVMNDDKFTNVIRCQACMGEVDLREGTYNRRGKDGKYAKADGR